eukprot:gene10871-3487_t
MEEKVEKEVSIEILEEQMKNLTLKKKNEIEKILPKGEIIETKGGGRISNKDLYGSILRHEKYEEVKEKLETSIEQEKKKLSEKLKKRGSFKEFKSKLEVCQKVVPQLHKGDKETISNTSEELKQLKKVIRRKLEDYEEENSSEDEKLLKLAFKDLFQEWVGQKSNFMSLFDEMLNFNSEDVKFEIMKDVKSGKIQDENIFFEIERCFKMIEIHTLKEKNELMEQKIQQLEYLLLTGKKVELVPHDAVFIE